ncbi:MAG: phytanoyl-CoA dioxygenase family protein [Xenococcaceae cyanobacterium MO_188.B32]|nr:phytanoyl-CoA dioxygenase family protein [Xenococcaceae cyanobacterium MO_188.B32]
MNICISEKSKQQFYEQGYCILKNAISKKHLEILGDECDRILAVTQEEMEQAKTDIKKLNHRDRRYFFCAYHQSDRVHEFIYSDLMEQICRSFLGDTAYFFYESYVVKSPWKGMEFSWHQDSGYIASKHKPYITCWCTLDDVNQERGSIYVLPYEEAGTRVKQPHFLLEEGGIEMVGYFGDATGIPIIASAGSIVILSSTVFHRSGKNTSDYIRRAYLVDFCLEPIMSYEDETKLYSMAEPFLQNGHRVR